MERHQRRRLRRRLRQYLQFLDRRRRAYESHSPQGDSRGSITESKNDSSDTSYTTTSAIESDGKWHTAGDSESTSDGSHFSKTTFNDLPYYRLLSISSLGAPAAANLGDIMLGLYRGDDSTPHVSGTFSDFDVSGGTYHYESSAVLDSKGNWGLSTGAGSTIESQSSGQCYNGNSTFGLNVEVPVPAGSVPAALGDQFPTFTLTGSGHVTETGASGNGAKETILSDVAGGNWRQPATSSPPPRTSRAPSPTMPAALAPTGRWPGASRAA